MVCRNRALEDERRNEESDTARVRFRDRDGRSGPFGHGRDLAAASRVRADVKRFVFVLQSRHDPTRQFVEATTHVAARLATHNAGHSPLTAAHRPWRLTTVLQFASEPAALRFERFLKTQAGRTLVRQYFGRDEAE
jgi:predicted GIY-YIG superfamily endonuclease